MAKTRLNPWLAKIHRNYTVEEAARLYGLHRNTVRQWIKRGLPVIVGHLRLLAEIDRLPRPALEESRPGHEAMAIRA